ncbi:Methyl-CpG-binding domain-containing protein 2 [Forsythia ovata]|uniref:Methyl-CpG-binding domain-containing protein 2 n=1 Tax=Forsythia ovata TaxID=205694 RepID=A0ABD1X4U5_9LAMI
MVGRATYKGTNVKFFSIEMLPFCYKNGRSLSNVSTRTEVVFATSSKKTSKRVWDSIAAYAFQCANYFKWRFILAKEKYEDIRETIVEQPFLCEMACEWRPEITCDDEPDLVKDGSWHWAIHKPSIPQPPPGSLILRIRAEGDTKYVDVYYAVHQVSYCNQRWKLTVT